MAKKISRGASHFSLEQLESRELLSWSNTSMLMDQDLSVSKYPSINGSNQTIVVLDSTAP